jgi:hypothetical protein
MSSRRIDRPVLPERPLSGRLCPAYVATQVPVARLVSAVVYRRARVRPPPACWPRARTRDGPCGSHRGHGNSCGAQPDTGSGTAAAAGHGQLQARRAWSVSGQHVHPVAVRERERSCRGHCRTPPPRPSGMPSRFRTPTDALPHPVSPGGHGARGTGRQVGGRWWDAASAGGHERAGRSGGRGAGRGHRSSPAG